MKNLRVLRNLGDVEGIDEVDESLFGISSDSLRLTDAKISTLWLKGNYQEVIYLYETHINIGSEGFGSQDFVTHSYFKLNNNNKSQELSRMAISKIIAVYDNDPNLIDRFYELAVLAYQYSMLGQQTEAIDYIERAIDMGWLQNISSDQFFEPLYDHPRFQELVAKQNKKREEVMALVATYNFPEPEDL